MLLQKYKKCAAEATHRKTHNSDCCDTTFDKPQEKAKRENVFLPKIKTLPLWFILLSCVAIPFYHKRKDYAI